MTVEYSNLLLQNSLAILLDNGNFAKTEKSCIGTLENLVVAYTHKVWTAFKHSAESGESACLLLIYNSAANRANPTLIDAGDAMHRLKIPLHELMDYTAQVEPIAPGPAPIAAFPRRATGDMHSPVGPKEAQYRLTHMPHVPAWLPPIFPHMDDDTGGLPLNPVVSPRESKLTAVLDIESILSGTELTSILDMSSLRLPARSAARSAQKRTVDELPDFMGLDARALGLFVDPKPPPMPPADMPIAASNPMKIKVGVASISRPFQLKKIAADSAVEPSTSLVDIAVPVVASNSVESLLAKINAKKPRKSKPRPQPARPAVSVTSVPMQPIKLSLKTKL